MPNLNVVAVKNKTKSKSRITGTTRLGKTIKKIVKKEIKKNEETKLFYASTTASALASNLVYTLSPTQGISVGTSAQARIGNEIFIQNLTLNMKALSAETIASTNIRVIVMWNDVQKSGGWAFNPTGLVEADFLLASSDNINSLPNYKLGVNILYDQVISMRSSCPVLFTATANTKFTRSQVLKRVTIPLKGKKVVWEPSTNYFNDKQLYVVIIPQSQDVGVIPGVTTVGALDIQALLSFKDA